LRCDNFFGGVSLDKHKLKLGLTPPHVAVGTPGRVLDLVKSGHMKLDKLRFFILDECDKILDQIGKRYHNKSM
jgi:ATP-dependent RNA helicase UAP56/SUB2